MPSLGGFSALLVWAGFLPLAWACNDLSRVRAALRGNETAIEVTIEPGRYCLGIPLVVGGGRTLVLNSSGAVLDAESACRRMRPAALIPSETACACC